MKNLSIVWDMTPVCPHNCPICCMGAKSGSPSCPELDYGAKHAIVGQLRRLHAYRSIRMDLSGGEIMTDLRNLEIAEEISLIIGKDNLGISTSGHGITDDVACRLASIVGEVELTMDSLPEITYRLRPLSYARDAARSIPLLKKHKIRVGIQTVLAKSNCTEASLTSIYRFLCENQVDEWSLLRFVPSGRGAMFPEEVLTEEETLHAVHLIQQLDRENPDPGKPALHFQYNMKGHAGYTEECRCVRKSIGIFPDGRVTACFWASDAQTHILDDRFYLGNVMQDTLYNILTGEKAAYWLDSCHTCSLHAPGKGDGHVPDTKRRNRVA